MSTKRTFKVETHSNLVLSSLNKLRDDNDSCDVILQVENKTFPAHRAVLSASSVYFFKMFTVNMKEKQEKIVTFNDISPDAFQAVIDFIYTGDVTITEDNVSSLLHVTSLMQVHDLHKVIVEYLNKVLNVQNGLQFRKLGVIYSLTGFANNVDKYILKHFQEFLLQKEFFNLNVDDLESLLESDDLNVEEETKVYEVVVKWTNQDEHNRKNYFSRLFKVVRLQFVPIKFVARVVRRNKLVREFLDCRDLVEDAFLFHIDPEMVVAEIARPSYTPEPDSILIVHPAQTYQMQFHVPQKTWYQIRSTGWRRNLLNMDCSVAFKHGMYMFCGGRDNSNRASNSVIQFNGCKWKTVSSMNEARCGCAAVYYKNDLFVFGGERTWIDPSLRYQGNTPNLRSRADFVESFEVLSKNWKIAGNATFLCSYASAEVIQDKVYVIGGYTLNTSHVNQGRHQPFYVKKPSVCSYIYEFKENKWSNGPNLNVARAEFGSAVIRSTIYVLGGYGMNGSVINDVEFLETSGNVWTRINCTAPYKLMHVYACSAQGQIYVKSSSADCLIRFDPNSQTWFTEEEYIFDGASLVIPITDS